MNKEQNLIISIQLAQEVVDFLVQQPYHQVANIVQKLQQLKLSTENK